MFRPASSGNTGVDHGVIVPVIIADSNTIAIGDCVKLSSGYAVRGTAGVQLLGIAVGFSKNEGTPLDPATYVPGTATSSDVTSVTAAANNTTAVFKKVLVDVSTAKIWSADVTGTIGTTVNSDRIGARIDVDSAGGKYGYVLETTATRTESTVANFFCYGTDPDDDSRLLVSLSSSYLIGKQG